MPDKITNNKADFPVKPLTNSRSRKRCKTTEERLDILTAKLKAAADAEKRNRELASPTFEERPVILAGAGRDEETYSAHGPSESDITEFHANLMNDCTDDEYENILKWLGLNQNKKSGFDK